MEKLAGFLEKPNDEIRLVSNLMALNDILNKYEYKPVNPGEIIRETQYLDVWQYLPSMKAFIA